MLICFYPYRKTAAVDPASIFGFHFEGRIFILGLYRNAFFSRDIATRATPDICVFIVKG